MVTNMTYAFRNNFIDLNFNFLARNEEKNQFLGLENGVSTYTSVNSLLP